MVESQGEQFEKLAASFEQEWPALTVSLARKYLSDYPDDECALMLYGVALQTLGRYKEARQALENALCLFPENKHYLIYRQLGSLYQDMYDEAEAERWFKRAIENGPDKASNYIYLGTMLARTGKLDEAESYHRQAIAFSCGNKDEAFLSLGYVLRAKEEYVEAFECFRKALEINPDCRRAQDALSDVEKVI